MYAEVIADDGRKAEVDAWLWDVNEEALHATLTDAMQRARMRTSEEARSLTLMMDAEAARTLVVHPAYVKSIRYCGIGSRTDSGLLPFWHGLRIVEEIPDMEQAA